MDRNANTRLGDWFFHYSCLFVLISGQSLARQ
jgi:hypothetical protein